MAKHLTPKAIQKIHALYASGLSGLEIAKRLNRSAPTIYNALKNAGGAEPAKTPAVKSLPADLSSIEAMVDRMVKERVTAAIEKAIGVLRES